MSVAYYALAALLIWLSFKSCRGGLAYLFSVLGPLRRAYAKLRTNQDQDRWLAELSELPLAHQPGARLTYGVGTDCGLPGSRAAMSLVSACVPGMPSLVSAPFRTIVIVHAT